MSNDFKSLNEECLIALADYYGARRDKKSGKDMYTCPLCKSGEHVTSSTGAFHIGRNKNGKISFYCHSCGRFGNIASLWCEYHGVENTKQNFPQIIRGIKSDLGMPIEDTNYQDFKKKYQFKGEINQDDLNPQTTVEPKNYSNWFKYTLWKNQSHAVNYLKTRGIENAEKIAYDFNMGYGDYKWNGTDTVNAVFVPMFEDYNFNSEAVYSFSWRAVDQDLKRKHGKIHPLVPECIKPNSKDTTKKWIYLVEGEYDFFSILDIQYSIEKEGKTCEFSAISINSAGNLPRFIDELYQNGIISSDIGLIIALDNDKEFNQNVENFKAKGYRMAQKYRIPCIIADVKTLYLGEKDSNEALKKDRAKFQQALKLTVEQAKLLDINTYMKECEQMEKEIQEQNNNVVAHQEEPTPELPPYIRQKSTPLILTKNTRELPPYIRQKINKKTGEVSYTLNTESLADVIRKQYNFILVKYANDRQAKPDFYLYEHGVYKLKSLEELKAFIKSYYLESYKYYNTSFVDNKYILKVCNSLYTDYFKFVDSEELNQDENIINFRNGLLYLDTMELKPHSSSIYSTIQISCNYNPNNVNAPIFNDYLDTLSNSNEDIKRVLLEVMGIAISNIKGYKMKKALFTIGKGDTGKSQLRLLTNELIGFENTSGIDLDTLEERFGTSAIYQKRVIGSADMGFMNVKQLRTFKQITGGDAINCEFKGGAFFSYVFDGVVWFSANEMPRFGGDKGDWVYNRMIIVKCDNVIEKEKQDKNLVDKMHLEGEAIINMLIPHIKEVIKNGYEYHIPQECIANREEYKKENSLVKLFLDECTEPRKVYDSCTTKKMYDVFKAWCGDNARGYTPTNQEFRKELVNIYGVNDIKDIQAKVKGNWYYPFTLTLSAKQDYVKAYGYDSIQ